MFYIFLFAYSFLHTSAVCNLIHSSKYQEGGSNTLKITLVPKVSNHFILAVGLKTLGTAIKWYTVQVILFIISYCLIPRDPWENMENRFMFIS